METTELYRILNMTRDTAVAGVAAAATWKPEKLTQMLRHNMYWNMEIILLYHASKVSCVPALSV